MSDASLLVAMDATTPSSKERIIIYDGLAVDEVGTHGMRKLIIVSDVIGNND